jgi:putative acetyltransferase
MKAIGNFFEYSAMQYLIRPEKEGDFDQISQVNDIAFGTPGEALLVLKLRNRIDFIPGLSLVAVVGDRVVGHILLYPVRIISRRGQPVTSLSLAPMSVLPEYQRKGIGSALVREGLKRSKESGYESVIVLGHADYYPRFGFLPASRWKIICLFPAPDEAFMALELISGALKGVEGGVVEYPPEFYELDEVT